jgi:hypothetical protein
MITNPTQYAQALRNPRPMNGGAMPLAGVPMPDTQPRPYPVSGGAMPLPAPIPHTYATAPMQAGGGDVRMPAMPQGGWGGSAPVQGRMPIPRPAVLPRAY